MKQTKIETGYSAQLHECPSREGISMDRNFKFDAAQQLRAVVASLLGSPEGVIK